MLKEWYEKIGYKKLMVVPVIILIVCAGFLLLEKQRSGEFIKKGMDFEGGSQLSLEVTGVDERGLENYLEKDFGEVDIKTTVSASGETLIVICGEVEEEELIKKMEEYGLEMENYSFQKIGSSLGKAFFSQSRMAIGIAVIFMAVVVFVVFRNFTPSIAVIFAAVSDIVCTLGVMQVMGLELTLASFAGLLMVIGYSIDTDILLTTRILKRREGEVTERIVKTLKTGFTMSATTLGALLGLYIASGVGILQQISTVLIIALLIDLPNTYLMNLGILRWWMEKRGVE